jgi:hypothetical protein
MPYWNPGVNRKMLYIWPTLIQTWVDTIAQLVPPKEAFTSEKTLLKTKDLQILNIGFWSFPASLLMLSKCALQDRNDAERNKFLHGCRHTSKLGHPQAAIMETTWCGEGEYKFYISLNWWGKKNKIGLNINTLLYIISSGIRNLKLDALQHWIGYVGWYFWYFIQYPQKHPSAHK